MLLAAFVGLSVVCLTLARERQQAVAAVLRSTVLAPFLAVQEFWVVERGLRTTIGSLQDERDSLAAVVVSLQDVVRETERLRGLVDLAQRAGPHFVAANLVPSGRSAGDLQTFLLDVGTRQDVRPPAPVVTAAGLVGVVRAASGDHSAGDFWTHADFRASAMTEDGRIFGIVRPGAESNGGPPVLWLSGVPYHVDLEAGTRIVTSGLGGIFPRGLPVGRILDLVRAEEGWSKTYRVEPFVPPGAAVEVLVLRGGAASPDVGELWPGDRVGATDSAPAGVQR